MYRQQRIYDVVTVGRSVVDLYPLQDGLAPKDVTSFGQYLGGSPTNVAVAAARAGLRSAVVTRTGDDMFHEFVTDQLREFGVGTRWVRRVGGARTTLAVCDLSEPSSPRLQFFRDKPAPEETIGGEDLLEAAASCHVLWLTASGFSGRQSATAHEEALRSADHVVLDLDYRPDFWSSERELHDRLEPILPHVSTVIGNAHESSIALGTTAAPDELARRLLSTGPTLAVVKRGAHGALAATPDRVLEQPSHAVHVINGLGAGDAFGGYFLKGLIESWPLEDSLRYACAAGAIVASRRGCSIAMPTQHEVTAAAVPSD